MSVRAALRRPHKLNDPVRAEILIERSSRNALWFLAEIKRVSRNDLIREALERYLAEEANDGSEGL